MERLSLGDFCDVVYAYAINSPEGRNEIRSGLLGYMFDFTEVEPEVEMSFEGFTKTAMSPDMLAELDAFGQ